MKRNGTCAPGALQRSNVLRHKHATSGLGIFGGSVIGDHLLNGDLVGDAAAEKSPNQPTGQA
jgi:hypothetical protein